MIHSLGAPRTVKQWKYYGEDVRDTTTNLPNIPVPGHISRPTSLPTDV